MITVESYELESLFLVRRCTFRDMGGSYMKTIGSR